jgi:hypothetical protein
MSDIIWHYINWYAYTYPHISILTNLYTHRLWQTENTCSDDYANKMFISRGEYWWTKGGHTAAICKRWFPWIFSLESLQTLPETAQILNRNKQKEKCVLFTWEQYISNVQRSSLPSAALDFQWENIWACVEQKRNNIAGQF